MRNLKSREERFWEKVDKKGAIECWNWTGAKAQNGYGKFYWGTEHGRRICMNSHKASWLLSRGHIPKHRSYHGLCVLHKCDNGMCVNPRHLWLGTNKDNADDMIKKGRLYVRKGEELGVNKLTQADVIQIRCSRRSPHDIARQFGMTVEHIRNVIRGKSWKHI